MAQVIKMPSGGQTATESVIVCWRVQEGDRIQKGDVLFEIETDKAVMEVESYASGTLLKICCPEGEAVEAGLPVAYIGEPNEQISALPEAEETTAEDDYRPIPHQPVQAEIQAKEQYQQTVSKPEEQQPQPTDLVMASPAARALAKEKCFDIKEIYKSLNCTVKKADVLNYIDIQNTEYDVIIPSAMRRTIAHRMMESANEVPQFTVSVKVDMTQLIDCRNQINAYLTQTENKVSFNDLLVKSICTAARTTPYINSQYVSDSEIRLARHVNVGIAVAVPDGLIVPVIKKADTLRLTQIAQQSSSLVQKARELKLTREEMSGGCITISNLGMYGIDHFTALINPPESTILAVGVIMDTPVADDGQIVLRPMMDITATFDHRMIDGSTGALFMAELKKIMEHPISMLI